MRACSSQSFAGTHAMLLNLYCNVVRMFFLFDLICFVLLICFLFLLFVQVCWRRSVSGTDWTPSGKGICVCFEPLMGTKALWDVSLSDGDESIEKSMFVCECMYVCGQRVSLYMCICVCVSARRCPHVRICAQQCASAIRVWRECLWKRLRSVSSHS